MPTGVAIDALENVYVADSLNYAIRKITPAGLAATIGGAAGQPGDANGQGPTARFNQPAGVAIDEAGVVYVAENQVNQTVRGGFPHEDSLGSVRVTITPAEAASAGAQWQLDGGTFMDSDRGISGLLPGEHTIAFKSLAGWTSPTPQKVLVTAKEMANAAGLYTRTGSLTVSITPSAVIAAGGQWQVDGGAFQNSGSSVPALAMGSHTIRFKPVAGWITPPDQVVNVAPSQAAPVIGAYTPADKDADGLEDPWELEHFSSLGVASADGDADRDGYSDREEFTRGTDPGVRSPRLNQPDGLIGLSAGKLIGGNVYDRNGAKETVRVSGARAQRKTAVVYLQNDSPATGSIKIKGTGGSKDFSVRYIYSGPRGPIDVTRRVTTGTLMLGNIAPGASRVLKAIVVPRATAPRGAKSVLNIDLTSPANPQIRDRVVFETKVP
jgi:hypothetical protein